MVDVEKKKRHGGFFARGLRANVSDATGGVITAAAAAVAACATRRGYFSGEGPV